MTKYVIRYKLDGERRWDFAQLASGSVEEATAALAQIHGDDAVKISDIHVSKAL
ncbi:hypothetical protein [Pseudomonas sp. dw_358]|uniref:hypothetical protein n=1 Tax=Pseudomonas sp. dw_358 TaxID=2720083 RepID=UPI001BD626CF|nr:hypothetical protein [Pseudomonas sp. dw_358]